MAGSITQLGALGAQDVDTVIRPSKTFWKSKHSRHTSFAMEPKQFEFQNVVDYGRNASAVIPRNGDLLAKLWLVFEIAAATTDGSVSGMFVDDAARAIIEEVSFEAGSVLYDRLRPEFLHVWEELTVLRENQLGRVTGKSGDVSERASWGAAAQRFYVPLEFWFQREYGAAIPLVALHLTDLKINLKLKAKTDIMCSQTGASYTATGGAINACYLLGEFVFLDDPERDFFARTEHKYLITQNQYYSTTVSASSATTQTFSLTFNHPTKELIIFGRQSNSSTSPPYVTTNSKSWFNFVGQEPAGMQEEHLFSTLAIVLNGNDRVKKRDPLYYRSIQCQQHHTRIPSKHIYVYSFALSPESPSPSGSLNLSRIENCQLTLEFTSSPSVQFDLHVIARSMNVCSAAGGVLSLRWSS